MQPDRVSLMTVHAAKGIEFKHVIVVGLTDKPQITINLNLAFDPDSQLFSLARRAISIKCLFFRDSTQISFGSIPFAKSFRMCFKVPRA